MDSELSYLLSDNPLFNAGKGAVFNSAGFVRALFSLSTRYTETKLLTSSFPIEQNELEASLALSHPPASHPHVPPSRRALSLTLLTRTRNPSQLARALYLSPASTRHAFLSGVPAEDLGGLPLVDPSYFYTSTRWREHRRGLGLPEDSAPGEDKREGDDDDDDEEEGEEGGNGDESEVLLDMMPTGTVGAVALDVRGCVAACTSTGGRTNKLPGRVGDTPHLGAGFWAEEWQASRWRWRRWLSRPRRSKVHAVGVSGTGDGDVRPFFPTRSGDKVFSALLIPFTLPPPFPLFFCFIHISIVLYSPEHGSDAGTPDAVPRRVSA